MNILIFCLTLLVCCGILSYAHKKWKEADVKEKMEEIEGIEHLEAQVFQFKKAHKGDLNKKKNNIKNFTEE